MSKSQPKPKIIYKNLQDLIKISNTIKNPSSSSSQYAHSNSNSNINANANTTHYSNNNDINKKYNTQRSNTNTNTNTNAKAFLFGDITNSLDMRRDRPRGDKEDGQGKENQGRDKSALRNVKFVKVSKTQAAQAIKGEEIESGRAVDVYDDCYNQIDAIFTEIEDFFCQAKEKVLTQIRNMLKSKQHKKKDNKKVHQKVDQIKKMSDYIKHISKFFIDGQIPELSISQSNPSRLPESQSLSLGYSLTRPTHQTVATIPTEAHQYGQNENLNGDQGQFFDQNHVPVDDGKMLSFSLKNSKIRRKGEKVRDGKEKKESRKKTVYQLILQQKQKKMKTSISRKSIQKY